MNRLLTKKESTGYPTSLSFTLASALLLSLCSTNALANRPAMDDGGETVNEVVEDTSQARPTMEAAIEIEAQPEAPSSVDLMMQKQTQQTYQTGDVVQLPAKEIQAGETLKIQLLDYPRRGMSMDKVQFEYGQPIAISDSVGKPPITRWTYNDRVVYFERATVLHVVAR